MAGPTGQAVQLCAHKGFQAVEIDNVDSCTRSGGVRTAEDNLAMATALARVAHADGVAIGRRTPPT